ncbi:hypothetical protein R0381_000970 [Jeongeupia wiesaeckerbachi]|uniref:hypothetical protein n=1 Tax=Jeongeupia wiesaeckerbachi TaxID=3051218 RepID=UPI003D80673E
MNTPARHLLTLLAPLLGIAVITLLAIGLLSAVRQQLDRQPGLQDATNALSDVQLASAADWIASNRGTAYKQEAGKPWALDKG